MSTTFLYATVLHLLSLLPLASVARAESAASVIAEGRSLRLETPEGPVRIWQPADYDPATAATVVYVHGYKRSADSVWSTGALPDQFRASARNAVFIVPTMAENDRAPLRWGHLESLLDKVARAGVAPARGPGGRSWGTAARTAPSPGGSTPRV